MAPAKRSSTRLRPGPLVPLLFLACLLLMGLVPQAAAHAALVSAEPPRNSELDTAPTELVLRFSEPYETRTYTQVRVFAEDDERYDLDNHFEQGNTAIRVPLAPMPDGLYTVKWQTLGTDTHQLQGVYFLAVNVTFNGTLPPTSDRADQGLPEEGFGAEVAIRAVGFLAGSLAAGISLFVLVLPRGDPLDAARNVHHRTTAVAGIVAALAAILLLVLIARRIDGAITDVIRTQSGTWLAVRAGAFALAGLAAAVTARWEGAIRRDDALIALFGIIGLVATTMASHAAAEPTLRGLAIAIDLVHLLAVAFWIGGLMLLALLIVRRIPAPTLYQAVRRFSPLAVAAVALIVLTGIVASGLRILSPADLTGTVYGRALLLKILLLVPLIGLGAFNRYLVQPRLALEDSVRAVVRLRQSVLAEMAIMVVTLVAAATLASVAPPDVLQGAEDAVAPDDPRAILTTFEAKGLEFTVRAEPQPLTVGTQTVTVTAERVSESQAEVHDIVLVLRSPDEGPSAEGDAQFMEEVGDMEWRLSGFLMPQKGVWHNDIVVQGARVYHSEHVPMFVE